MSRVRPTMDSFAASAVELGGAIKDQDGRSGGRLLKDIDLVPLAHIKDRKGGDLRPVNLAFVMEKLAGSIQSLGLIEPIVVDQDFDLIAGAHRRFALALLEQDPKHRQDWVLQQIANGVASCLPSKFEHYANASLEFEHITKPVPVRVIEINSEEERAVAIEIAENEVRRDFTREEVVTMKKTLEERGYSFGGAGGRPAKGAQAKAGLPLLAGAFHKSDRHIRRLLAAKEEEKAAQSREAKMAKNLKQFLQGSCSNEVREWAERGILLLEGD